MPTTKPKIDLIVFYFPDVVGGDLSRILARLVRWGARVALTANREEANLVISTTKALSTSQSEEERVFLFVCADSNDRKMADQSRGSNSETLLSGTGFGELGTMMDRTILPYLTSRKTIGVSVVPPDPDGYGEKGEVQVPICRLAAESV